MIFVQTSSSERRELLLFNEFENYKAGNLRRGRKKSELTFCFSNPQSLMLQDQTFTQNVLFHLSLFLTLL